MKKFKITKGDRVYIVDAKSHIDAISKVKAVKDSSIKDYSPEVYVKELEKLIPEYQRLGDLKSKIRESLVSSGKMDKSKMGPDFKLILNDAKVQQWLKQVRELDKKWNNLLTNLNRFGTNAYKQQSNGSDLDVWLNSLPDSWTINDIKFAVKSESRKYKDSISQWNPGMSEIGLFQISYKRNGVYQSILVRANSEEQAKQKLLNNLNGVDIIGVNSHPSPHFHEPILDSSIKDDGYYYLLRDAIDLLTKPGAARGWSQPYLEEVQEYMVQKGINTTNVNQWKKKYESLTKDSSIKDGWSGVRSNGVIFNYSNGKYTITHKNGKVETFPGNKFNTAEELFKYIDNIKDSAIKDAYIDEWYENTSENAYMVAKRYGVSVKPIKKRGADVLYRFEGSIDKLNKMHSDGYFMSIDMAGNSIKDSSIKDADSVEVEKIIRKEKSALGITYYLFQTKSKSGATIYYEVTDKTYHGEPTYSGGGVISFSLQSANDSLDSHLLYDKLVSKYGEKAGRKRFLLGKNDTGIKDAKPYSIKYKNKQYKVYAKDEQTAVEKLNNLLNKVTDKPIK